MILLQVAFRQVNDFGRNETGTMLGELRGSIDQGTVSTLRVDVSTEGWLAQKCYRGFTDLCTDLVRRGGSPGHHRPGKLVSLQVHRIA